MVIMLNGSPDRAPSNILEFEETKRTLPLLLTLNFSTDFVFVMLGTSFGHTVKSPNCGHNWGSPKHFDLCIQRDCPLSEVICTDMSVYI